jgi:TonB family protein
MPLGYILSVVLALGSQAPSNADLLGAALATAAEQGNLAAIRDLLESGTSPDGRSIQGLTALMLAAANNHVEAVQLLLAKGAEIDAGCDEGRSALYMASRNGHSEVVEVLVDGGASVGAQTEDGLTALMWASAYETTPGHLETMRVLIGAGARVNATTANGATPLMLASARGRAGAVRLLLESGADTDVRANDKATALLLAAKEGHEEVVALLLESGADPDSPPQPVTIIRPAYPPEAFAKRVQGTVLVEILIDSSGRVVRARVIDSVPMLDEAALEAAYQWVFQPAIKDGKLVPTIAHAPIAFKRW